jgi:1-acyl-sn-glycerol-3-phosphate acyltransferase
MATPEQDPANAGERPKLAGAKPPPRAGARPPERAGARPWARPLLRAFRLARVGVSFLYFGLGVWLTGATLLPLLRLRARLLGLPSEVALRNVQRAVHHFCRSFIACMTQVMRVVEVQWIGAEALARGPVLVVANHPSLIDTPLLLSRMPQADFIVSPDWLRRGWLRGTVEAAEYMHSDDGAEVVREAVARLRAGRSVVVYPEGSRTPAEGLRRFQRGAAHIALEAGCDILPVTIQVTPRALMRGESWTDYPLANPAWRVEVGEPIRLEPSGGAEPRALAARRLTGVLEEYFGKRWERGRS